jgi:hypothetical protein
VPGGKRRQHDPAEQQQVLLACDPQRLHRETVLAKVRAILARVGSRVPHVVDEEDEPGGEKPRGSKAEGPGEGHALEIAEEKRGVAQRGETAPDVRHQEDEAVRGRIAMPSRSATKGATHTTAGTYGACSSGGLVYA